MYLKITTVKKSKELSHVLNNTRFLRICFVTSLSESVRRPVEYMISPKTRCHEAPVCYKSTLPILTSLV